MNDIEKSIIKLAKGNGFESELKVAAIASKANWKVQQNIYYIDKDERKGRELDLNLFRIFSADVEPHCFVQINLCIEIKRTTEPFIFFSNDWRDLESGMGWRLLNWSHNVDRHVLSYDDIERARPDKKPPRIARSYMAMKDGKTQQIQSAILSAVKGAIHFKDECNEQYSENSHDVCFFIPMVVVDGEIYECFYEDGSSELTANKVERLVYSHNYLSEGYGEVYNQVPIVTFAEFEKVVDEHRAWGKSMIERVVAQCDQFEPDD